MFKLIKKFNCLVDKNIYTLLYVCMFDYRMGVKHTVK